MTRILLSLEALRSAALLSCAGAAQPRQCKVHSLQKDVLQVARSVTGVALTLRSADISTNHQQKGACRAGPAVFAYSFEVLVHLQVTGNASVYPSDLMACPSTCMFPGTTCGAKTTSVTMWWRA